MEFVGIIPTSIDFINFTEISYSSIFGLSDLEFVWLVISVKWDGNEYMHEHLLHWISCHTHVPGTIISTQMSNILYDMSNWHVI